MANVAWSLGRYDMVMYMDTVFLQMLLWEHFGALAPMPMEYSATVPGGTGVVILKKCDFKARALL